MEPAFSEVAGKPVPEPQQNKDTQHLLAEILKRLDSVEKRLTNLEKQSKENDLAETEEEPEKEENIEYCSDFENTLCDRLINNITEISQEDKPEDEVRESDEGDRSKPEDRLISNKAMLWHVKMGHSSMNYLKKLQKKFVSTPELEEAIFDDAILDCNVCIISRINKLPLKSTGERATEPLQIIHFDRLGMISPSSYPKHYKYVSIFTDDYSRLAMAYPMKRKNEVGYYFELFVKTAQNLLGRDAKVSCLKSHQEVDFSTDSMSQVLERLGVELAVECSGTSKHNKHNQIFNLTIQKKVRVLMYDSGLPENMWDLALGTAVFAYNRTPHSSNDMKTPLEMFNPKYQATDLTRLKRFGCLSYVKVQRKVNQKMRFVIKRLILVGYKDTGYVLFYPEDGKFYTTREVRFNEKGVFAEKYKRTQVSNWKNVNKEIDTDTWFIEFEEEKEQQKESERNHVVTYNKRGREW